MLEQEIVLRIAQGGFLCLLAEIFFAKYNEGSKNYKNNMNKIILITAVLIILGAGAFLIFKNMQNSDIFEIQGMQVRILEKGSGPASENGDTVSVHYVGTFENGSKFDSSVDRETPFSFNLGAGQVIQGWDLGVVGMKVGEKRMLTIPYTLAYGEMGYGPIPPKATLVFEVQLLEITKNTNSNNY